MTFRSTAIAVLAAAAVSAPLAAHAATYEPFTATDPANGASSSSEPTNPGVDLVKVRATRTDTVFKVVATYVDLKRVNYSRRSAGLVQDGLSHQLEYRTGRPGSDPKVTFYEIDTLQETFTPVACKGARVVPDRARDRLTFVIPAACLPEAKNDGTYLVVGGAKWRAATWSSGPVDSKPMSQGPDQDDRIVGDWAWNPGPK